MNEVFGFAEAIQYMWAQSDQIYAEAESKEILIFSLPRRHNPDCHFGSFFTKKSLGTAFDIRLASHGTGNPGKTKKTTDKNNK